jgi:hypothetical protein
VRKLFNCSLLIAFILGFLFLSCATLSEGEVISSLKNIPERTIVMEGEPTAIILLEEDYKDREIQGAEELQEYIQKSTGARIPIIKEPEGYTSYTIRIKVREPGEGESREAFSIIVVPIGKMLSCWKEYVDKIKP